MNRVYGAQHQKLVDASFQLHAARWLDVYTDTGVEAAIYRRRLAIALRWVDELVLPRRERILEIGCGAGVSAVPLARRGYRVEAVDAIPAMVNATRSYAARAGVTSAIVTSLGDAHRLAFRDSTFGLIVAIGLLPYLHSPTAFLQEVARVLKPDGFLLVTVGNRWRLNHLLDPWLCPALDPVKALVAAVIRRGPRRPPSGPPLRLDSLRKFERWLSSVGLSKIKATTVGFQPLTFHRRPVLSEPISLTLNRWLQTLADHGMPGIRWRGMDHVVLARRDGARP